MSDSDDEEFAFYGKPLDPIEEDDVPRKKPIGVEEMEAVDKHGRRRFHGAFTGGFSAGFFNTVGSLEGWKPSTFKSSRGDRSKLAAQAPEDFMDEEDTEEFGIAPKALRARPEYESGKKRKAESGIALSSGPIPGEPVLKSILTPARETMGVLLLMRMGWKPGQGVGPRLTKLEKRMARRRERMMKSSLVSRKSQNDGASGKIYSCPTRDEVTVIDHSGSSGDSSDEDFDPNTLLAPEDWAGLERLPMGKEDSSGLDYVGLTRPGNANKPSESKTFTMVDHKNRRLAITGQAFGVGAFEEEDECVYSVDDRSQYDFSLEPINKSRKKSRLNDSDKLAIADGSADNLPGFVASKQSLKKKYFPPPNLPPGFVAVHSSQRTRFSGANATPNQAIAGPSNLDANDRSAILDTSIRIKQEVDDGAIDPVGPINIPTDSSSYNSSWRPFANEPEKQERYEKFLHLVKIGAKDAFSRMQPHTMTDSERGREIIEFETAAKLYKPLAGFLKERFTHGGAKIETDDDSDSILKEEEGSPKGLLMKEETWYPHELVCKRFNIANPHGAGGELQRAANEKRNRPKFSVFDFMKASQTNSMSLLLERDRDEGSSASRSEENDRSDTDRDPQTEESSENVGIKLSSGDQGKPSSSSAKDNDVLEGETVVPQVHMIEDDPPDKLDLFKAIFGDSDEEEDAESNKINEGTNNMLDSGAHPEKPLSSIFKKQEEKNVARNTSPPRGIFSGIDFDNLNEAIFGKETVKKSDEAPECSNSKALLGQTSPPKNIFAPDEDESKAMSCSTDINELPSDSYGPSLPAKSQIVKPTAFVNLKLDVEDDMWVEASKLDSTASDKHKHKKHKKEYKKKKNKHKTKRRKKDKKKKKSKLSSSEESTSSSD